LAGDECKAKKKRAEKERESDIQVHMYVFAPSDRNRHRGWTPISVVATGHAPEKYAIPKYTTHLPCKVDCRHRQI
jgi:hypothetical protein